MKKQLQQSILIVTLAVVGLSNSVNSQSIAAGRDHSIFLCRNKTVATCGWNDWGQLGDGTTDERQSPIPISSLTNIIAVAAGDRTSFFLKNDGTVWACGQNRAGFVGGVLGDGTTTDRHTPVKISSLKDVIAIAGGASHSLFLKRDNTVWACGSNNYGQLGFITDGEMTPVQIRSLTGIIAIAAGANYSLFLKNDGTVWACGENYSGQLGDGTTILRRTPVQVRGLNNIGFLTGITAIAGGGEGAPHSLFLKNDGTVWACGGNEHGELGDGTITQRNTPVQVHGLNDAGYLTNITAIAAGRSSYFLKNDSTVLACGANRLGELGDGTTTERHIPTRIRSLTGIIAIAAKSDHAMFQKSDGTFWACGDNQNGQLGFGTSDALAHSTPGQVTGLCSGSKPPIPTPDVVDFPPPIPDCCPPNTVFVMCKPFRFTFGCCPSGTAIVCVGPLKLTFILLGLAGLVWLYIRRRKAKNKK